MGAGRGNVIEISKYQLNIRQRAATAAAAEVYGSQWNYLLCFFFVQLINTHCILPVYAFVLEALKLFVVASADFNNKLAGRFPLRQVEIKSDLG